MKQNKYTQLILDAFSTLEGHDLLVERVEMSINIFENVDKQCIDENKIFGAEVKILSNNNGIVKVFSKMFMNKLSINEKFDTESFHHSQDPKCSFCKYRRRLNPLPRFEGPKETKMRPGELSREGFLGINDRLEEIIKKDKETLEKLGITHKQIADRIESITGQAKRIAYLDNGKKTKYIVEKIFEVELIGWMGYQNCPYGCKDTGSYDYKIKNLEFGKTLFAPELIVHLIKKHSFFEGNTKYRVDPQKAVKILEIKQGVDYTPKKAKEFIWSLKSASSKISKLLFPMCAEADFEATGKINLSENCKIFYNEKKVLILSEKRHELNEPLIINGIKLKEKFFEGQALYEKRELEYYILK